MAFYCSFWLSEVQDHFSATQEFDSHLLFSGVPIPPFLAFHLYSCISASSLLHQETARNKNMKPNIALKRAAFDL